MTQENKKVEISSEEHFSQKILLRQMREEARIAKLKSLFNQYKKQITYGVVVLGIIFVSFIFYYANLHAKNEEYSKMLHQFVVYDGLGNKDEAEKILNKIKNENEVPDQLKVLSLLKYGAKLIDEGRIKEAVEVYIQANELGGADAYMKDLAGLLAIKTMIDSDHQVFSEEIKRVLPKIEKKSSVLRPLISEQKAIFEWFSGNLVVAQEIFNNLSLDEKSPVYLQKRAKEFSEIISEKNSKKSL